METEKIKFEVEFGDEVTRGIELVPVETDNFWQVFIDGTYYTDIWTEFEDGDWRWDNHDSMDDDYEDLIKPIIEKFKSIRNP